MIKRELYTTFEDGTRLFRTYSDVRKKLIQVDTGIVYDEAIDIENTPHTYIESDEYIDEPEEEEPIPDTDGDLLNAQEAMNIIFGG